MKWAIGMKGAMGMVSYAWFLIGYTMYKEMKIERKMEKDDLKGKK